MDIGLSASSDAVQSPLVVVREPRRDDLTSVLEPAGPIRVDTLVPRTMSMPRHRHRVALQSAPAARIVRVRA
jgi:hypothetical protein